MIPPLPTVVIKLGETVDMCMQDTSDLVFHYIEPRIDKS